MAGVSGVGQDPVGFGSASAICNVFDGMNYLILKIIQILLCPISISYIYILVKIFYLKRYLRLNPVANVGKWLLFLSPPPPSITNEF